MTDRHPWLHLNSRGLNRQALETLFWDTFNGSVMQFEWRPYEERLALDAAMTELPGLKIALGRGRAVASRTQQTIRDGNDDLVFSVNIDSSVSIVRKGEVVSVPPQGAFLASCTEPFSWAGDLGIGIRVSRQAISHLIPNIDDRVAKPIPVGHPAVRLLVQYLDRIRRHGLPAPEAARLAGPHLQDLIALAVGAPRDQAVAASRRGLSAARRMAIEQDIAGLVGREPVSAELLARRHGVSPRYVRMLFEREGTSLWTHVLDAQLDRAMAGLTDAKSAGRPISDIAYDAGFGDVSYFNRTFRRRFGMRPKDARAVALASARA